MLEFNSLTTGSLFQSCPVMLTMHGYNIDRAGVIFDIILPVIIDLKFLFFVVSLYPAMRRQHDGPSPPMDDLLDRGEGTICMYLLHPFVVLVTL